MENINDVPAEKLQLRLLAVVLGRQRRETLPHCRHPDYGYCPIRPIESLYQKVHVLALGYQGVD